MATAAYDLADRTADGFDDDDAAAEMGIAKPSPSAFADTAVFTPMTAPVASRSGPPLLPGLIAASVWRRFVRVVGWPVDSSWTVMVRPGGGSPFTDSVKVPSGLPIAIAVSPTWSSSSSPMTAGVSPVASILISARSVSFEMSTTFAGNWRPSASSTVRLCAVRDHVVVGEDVPLRRQDDPGPDAGRRI